MKTAFDGVISRLAMAEKRIPELEEDQNVQKQKKKKSLRKTPQN